MATYKYGRWRQYGWNDGVYGTVYHIIYKKTFWGTWKEWEWCHDTVKGGNKMQETIKALEKAGNIVYPS